LGRPEPVSEPGQRSLWKVTFPTVIFLLTFGLSYFIPRMHFSPRVESGLVLLVPLVVCFLVSFRSPAVFALGLAALMVGAIPYTNATIDTLAVQRNFFGIWRVTSSTKEDFRSLYHGTTIHGVQFNDPGRKCEATSYYSKDGPLGQVFDVYNHNPTSQSVAAVGLGAGTIGTYSRAGQQWDFYDIDPNIIRIASEPRYFTFLSECTAGSYRIIPGDARLRLSEALDGTYGLIVMDAFSSDSVPAHLLTTEALSLYFSKLSPDGVLAFHISNRYLDLEPLLAGLSRSKGLSSYMRYDDRPSANGRFAAAWVLVARSDAAAGAIANDARWRRLRGDVVWTDDFSNILGVLR
jgi:spermidine synthase